MNFRDEAHAIVEQQNNEKWGETRDKIEKALMSAYQVGFLDGEAGVPKCHNANCFGPAKDDPCPVHGGETTRIEFPKVEQDEIEGACV